MIGYLKFTTKVFVKPSICNHYVLHVKTKFFVMTSKPVNGLKGHLISNTNIDGDSKPQYVIAHAHTFDPSKNVIEYSQKGMDYLALHQAKFQPVIEALQSLSQ